MKITMADRPGEREETGRRSRRRILLENGSCWSSDDVATRRGTQELRIPAFSKDDRPLILQKRPSGTKMQKSIILRAAVNIFLPLRQNVHVKTTPPQETRIKSALSVTSSMFLSVGNVVEVSLSRCGSKMADIERRN